jgi:hypothetical protein
MENIKNFKNFLYICWKAINLPDPTDIQYSIADYLQFGGRNKIIQAFRGIGKTWITAAYVCFKLYQNPNEKILIVSASKDKAVEIAKFIKDLINILPQLQHLKPDTRQDNRDAITAFDVAGCTPAVAPSVKVLGVGGQLTGCRATIIIADDIETSENCRSQEMRDKIKNAVTEFDNIIVPGGEITYLGTPHTEQSLYNELVRRGYLLRIWTAKYVSPDKQERYNGNLAPFIIEAVQDDFFLVDTSTEPLRFSDEDLMEREMKMGRSKFQMQFMLDPTLNDMERYPLKCSDLIVMDLDKDKAPEKVAYASDVTKTIENVLCPGFGGDRFYKPMYISDKWLEYTQKIMFLDPAGTGSDEFSYVVLGLLNSQIFLLDFGILLSGYTDKNLIKLALVAKEYNINIAYYESNFGDDLFSSLFQPYLRKYHPCALEAIRNNKNKELRIIETLEPVLNQHKLIVNKSLIEKDSKLCEHYPPEHKSIYQLFYQLTHITKDRGCLSHDDRLDALAGGVAQLNTSMSLDVDEEIRNREQEQWEAAINEQLEKMGLDTIKDNTWFDI